MPSNLPGQIIVTPGRGNLWGILTPTSISQAQSPVGRIPAVRVTYRQQTDSNPGNDAASPRTLSPRIDATEQFEQEGTRDISMATPRQVPQIGSGYAGSWATNGWICPNLPVWIARFHASSERPQASKVISPRWQRAQSPMVEGVTLQRGR